MAISARQSAIHAPQACGEGIYVRHGIGSSGFSLIATLTVAGKWVLHKGSETETAPAPGNG